MTSCLLPTQLHSRSTSVYVNEVLDGDTIVVNSHDGYKEIYRLAYIDAPEIGQLGGKRSKRNLEKLILNKDVLVDVKQKDEYERKLVTVELNGSLVNLKQVSDGYAWSLTQQGEKNIFRRAEVSAKKYNKGIWYKNKPIPPWIFKK